MKKQEIRKPESKFLLSPDPWGIMEGVRILFDEVWKKSFTNSEYHDAVKEHRFLVLYNQVLPEAWLVSKSTIWRHVKEIKDEIRDFLTTPNYVWVFKNPDMKKVPLSNPDVLKKIEEDGWENLPTYLEIEKTQQKWQQSAGYNQTTSEPLTEELILIKIS